MPGGDHRVPDKSFTFIMKTPPATVLIKKAAKIEKGSPRPHTDKVGKHHPRAGRGDRQDEDARPHRGRSGCRGAHDRRQRPQHGRRSGGRRNMAHDSKRYKALRAKVERTQALPGAGGAQARQGQTRPRSSTSRSTSRSTSASTRRNRTRRCAARWCCRRAPARACASRCSRRATRRKQARDAGADIVGFEDLADRDQGRQDGFRRRDRDARRDARGRPARPDPRPARPDAEPEGRDGDARTSPTAVKNAKAGQVQYRTDKAGIVQCTIGRASFTVDALKENLRGADRRGEQGAGRRARRAST